MRSWISPAPTRLRLGSRFMPVRARAGSFRVELQSSVIQTLRPLYADRARTLWSPRASSRPGDGYILPSSGTPTVDVLLFFFENNDIRAGGCYHHRRGDAVTGTQDRGLHGHDGPHGGSDPRGPCSFPRMMRAVRADGKIHAVDARVRAARYARLPPCPFHPMASVDRLMRYASSPGSPITSGGPHIFWQPGIWLTTALPAMTTRPPLDRIRGGLSIDQCGTTQSGILQSMSM